MSKTMSLIIRACGLFGISFVYSVLDTLDSSDYGKGDVFFPFVFGAAIVFGGLVVLAIGEILATLLRIEEKFKKEENHD